MENPMFWIPMALAAEPKLMLSASVSLLSTPDIPKIELPGPDGICGDVPISDPCVTATNWSHYSLEVGSSFSYDKKLHFDYGYYGLLGVGRMNYGSDVKVEGGHRLGVGVGAGGWAQWNLLYMKSDPERDLIPYMAFFSPRISASLRWDWAPNAMVLDFRPGFGFAISDVGWLSVVGGVFFPICIWTDLPEPHLDPLRRQGGELQIIVRIPVHRQNEKPRTETGR